MKDNNNIIKHVSTYMEKINELYDEIKREYPGNSPKLFFRGQSQQYDFILPSLMRKDNFRKNEDKMIRDFLSKDYELFINTNNNFDRLALMQHHQLPTRLLDLTANPLVALYFCVEKDYTNRDNKLHTKGPQKNGEIYIFSDFLNKKNLKISLNNDNLPLFFNYFAGAIFEKNNILKSSVSDTIEIESSLALLEKNDGSGFNTKLFYFLTNLNKLAESNKNAIDSWHCFYQQYIVGIKSPEKDFSALYKDFNEDISTSRLYHLIKTDIKSFDNHINPVNLYIPKIVIPREIDDRIKNQRGVFMLLPPINEDKEKSFTSSKSADERKEEYRISQKSIDELQESANDRINILRYKDGKDPTFIVPDDCKPQIREELKRIGIGPNFIYPGSSSVAKEIYERY
ncbi:FRG domain-containing protein [Companilactobacillus farciminis]|uniref:FRG domain-containing protein n=1 Tax=Companilactobacillus farciminis TaxID=1612 RepID=UPI00232F81AC|nr:FRG domain-containing protein [Companilactobacillus farciminis]WCG36007.1 FRG domain-containing protein [Companilactobacillus farciminis]